MTLAFRITPVELTTRNIDRVTTFQSDHCRTDSRTAFRAYLPVEISVSGLPDRIRLTPTAGQGMNVPRVVYLASDQFNRTGFLKRTYSWR